MRTTKKGLSSALLGLAAGIVLSLVMLDMLPDAWEMGGAFPFFIGFVSGVLVLWLISAKAHAHHAHDVDEADAHEIATKSLVAAGLLLAMGMAVHNLPQGIAIGSAIGGEVLASLSVLLFIHNIPEGMAMAIPLKIGGVPSKRILFVALLTALPTIVGALIGAAFAQLSPEFLSAAMAFASGAMIFLAVRELIPHSASLSKPIYSAVAVIAGFLTGGLLTWLLH